MKRSNASDDSYYWAMIAPALILMLVFYLYPLSQVLFISVSEPSPGVENYVQLATNGSLHRIFFTTARVSVLTGAIAVMLGYVVAYAMTTGSAKRQRWILILVVLPLWVSALVRAFSWIVLLRREGVVNSALQALGVIDAPLALMWNEIGVVIGMVHYMLPYAILPLYASMRDIDRRAVMAARGLGASRGQAFRKIFLPLSLPGIVAASALVLVYSLGFFIIPAIMGGGKTLMIAEYIRLQIVELVNWGLGTMLSTVLIAAIVVLLITVTKIIGARRLFGGGTA